MKSQNILSPQEKGALIKSLTEALSFAKSLPTSTSCKECEYYSVGQCEKWHSTIPPEVQDQGCDEWRWSRVPF